MIFIILIGILNSINDSFLINKILIKVFLYFSSKYLSGNKLCGNFV